MPDMSPWAVWIAAAPVVPPGTLGQRAQSLLGLGAFLLLAWWIGRLRGARGFPTRVVVWGMILQFVFGAIVLFAPTVLENVRYVDNGRIVTSSGVSAGIDMSLHVVAKLLGFDAAKQTARRMEYEWKPREEYPD